MFTTRKSRATSTSRPPRQDGVLHVPTSDLLWAALSKLSARWRCSVDTVAERALVMALSGWKLKFERPLSELSRFVTKDTEPFQRTCLLLRSRLLQQDDDSGEPLSDSDLMARLGMLLEELRERHTAGEDVDLVRLLAADDVSP